jgi:repressor LexA
MARMSRSQRNRENKTPLSVRQQAILAFVEEFSRTKGYPPTIRDVGVACSISSTSVVNYNLNILEREGLIERDRTVSRGIKLMGVGIKKLGLGTIRVPVLGTIAAGQPIPVFGEGIAQSAQEYLELTRAIVVKDAPDLYALRVKGDSMIDASIQDGDTIIVRQTAEVQNGEMVAAWLINEEETTLKRFFVEDGRIRLQPANPTYQPIYTTQDNVRVQGKVIAVIRQLD